MRAREENRMEKVRGGEGEEVQKERKVGAEKRREKREEGSGKRQSRRETARSTPAPLMCPYTEPTIDNRPSSPAPSPSGTASLKLLPHLQP